MRHPSSVRLMAAAAALVLACGCNSSRYGLHHDQFLPRLQRVGIVAPSIKVFSLHTGGVREERPDMEPTVRERAVAAIQEEVRRCQREPVLLDVPAAQTPATDGNRSGELALLAAVSEAIVTHHYLHGKQRTMDYVTGDASAALGCGDLDALLCVHVQGTVPTRGRELLKGTAFVMGALTGVRIPVPTKQATVAVMIADRRTGEVVWFNAAMKEIKVSDEHDLRALCRKACRHMFKPSE